MHNSAQEFVCEGLHSVSVFCLADIKYDLTFKLNILSLSLTGGFSQLRF